LKRELPSLKALQTFEAVARYGSATEAGKELNVTEPAVSQQIKNLENHMGTKLFARMPEGLLLSPEGKYLFPIVKRLFDEVDDAVAVVSKQKQRRSLTVRVSPHFSARWLTPRLGDFMQKHPNIDIYLQNSIDQRSFNNRDIDVAVTWETGNSGECSGDELMQLRWVPMCSPEILDRGDGINKPQDLQNYHLIHETDYEQWYAWFKASGVGEYRPQKGLMIDNYEVLYQAVLAGRGIALLMYPMFSDALERGDLVAPLGTDSPLLVKYFTIYSEEAAIRTEVELFREWLHDQASVCHE
jgi:LysR family glycine cleavage system transcriptional activator